jgi:hypothetical protein
MDTNDRFAELSALIAASRRAKFGRGVGPEIIADAERHLGLQFPPSYRWWLNRYGAGYLGGYELQGLFNEPIAARDPELPLVGDIVDRAGRNAAAKLYPPHLLELLSHEGDEIYFFDTLRRSADGEYPIVCLCAGNREPVDIAVSFAEFLRRELG